MNLAKLRAALHVAIDAFVDALAEGDAPPVTKPAPAQKPRASRKGAAIRTFKPTIDLTEEDHAKARAIARAKGI